MSIISLAESAFAYVPAPIAKLPFDFGSSSFCRNVLYAASAAITALLDVANSASSTLSVTSANAAVTSSLKKRMLPSICSIAISVKMRAGLSRFLRPSSRNVGIFFSRAISDFSRSAGGANFRFMIM